MFDAIERLKSEWTDRFVVISRPAPELARFAQATGVVRTVNMNGRCLVEFDQHNNIGWYDIDPAFLRVVPGPQPKPVAKAAPAKASTGEKPVAKAPAKPVAPRPSATSPAAPKAAAKPAGGRPSTADILALARGKKAAADAAAAQAPAVPQSEAPSGEPSPSEPESTPEPAAALPAAKGAATEKPSGGSVKLRTTAEKIAWCRSRDGKG